MNQTLLKFYLALLFSFGLLACQNSSNPYVESDEAFEAQNAEPAASVVKTSTAQGWFSVDMPEGANEIMDMASHNTTLYAVIKGMGLWSYKDQTWTKVADKAIRYGDAAIQITENGDIYAVHHRILWKLENNAWTKIPFDQPIGKFTYAGNGIFYMVKRKAYDEVFMYNANSNSFSDLNFPYTVDTKPHIKLEADKNGDLWYLTNYSGLYKYTKQSNEWKKIESTRSDGSIVAYNWSSGLGKSASGNIYYTREFAKTTQIMQVYRANEQDELELLHADVGYGANGVPVGNNPNRDLIFFNGARFGQFMVEGDKKYDIPSNTNDLGLDANQLKRVSQLHTTAVGERLYTTQKWKVGEQNYFRFLAIDLDVNDRPYYSSSLQTDHKQLIAQNVPSDVALEVLALEDGTVLAAVNHLGSAPNRQFITDSNEASNGLIYVQTPSGATLQTLDAGSEVLDIAASGQQIAIATQQKLMVYDLGTQQTLWSIDYNSNKKRVAIGRQGTVVSLLENNEIALYDAQGQQVLQKSLHRSYTEDVEINEKHGFFYVVGFDNKRLPSGKPVQVAFLNAIDLNSGDFIWQRFGFDGAALSNNIADTRLYRVSWGQDGQLYILGESAGSKTIFRYDGIVHEGSDMLTKIDHHNNLWDTGSAHITYHARVQAQSGDIMRAQLNMTRLSDGKSNTLRANDIAATQSGFTILGGAATAFLSNREAVRIDGQPLATYAGSDPSTIVLYPDFRQRRYWVSWHTQETAKGSVRSLSAFNDEVYNLWRTDDGQVWLYRFNLND